MGEYSIARVLATALPPRDAGRLRLRAPALLQSWPGIVHGGGLVALLDAAATRELGATGPRTLDGRLTSSVPVDTPLEVDARADARGASLAILGDGQTLTSVTVESLDGVRPEPPGWQGGGDGMALPMSEQCLACGADNPVGLRTALAFDGAGVWARLVPPDAWRLPDGGAHPAFAPVLLDEVAWWLGAVTMQEGGLTNRIAVTFPGAALGPGPLTAAGRLADVTPVDRKRTFWRTRVGLWTDDGALVAVGTIVFRGGAEYSARQMPYFRARTDPETFLRIFPARGRAES